MRQKKLTIYKKGKVTIGESIAERQQFIGMYGIVIAEFLPEISGWYTNNGYIESNGNLIDEMCMIAKMYGVENLVVQNEEGKAYEKKDSRHTGAVH